METRVETGILFFGEVNQISISVYAWNWIQRFLFKIKESPTLVGIGHSEPAPTSTPSRMDGKWSGNSFLLGSSCLGNHGD
jgi:hypothetical protein